MRSTVQNLQVLYEDNHLIALNKRSGDLVQGDRTGDDPLSEVLKNWLRKKYDKPGNVFLGVIHRLDRPVSGVVVFAKTGKALSRMNRLFKTKAVRKTYLAAVCSPPPSPKGRLRNFLKKNQKENKSYVVKPDKPNAKEALLDYELLGASHRYFFLRVEPHTGRHHQIRVQLAKMGCPIKGDVKYGAPRTNEKASIHLHAEQITFVHPVKNEETVISAPTPRDPVWDFFRDNFSDHG